MLAFNLLLAFAFVVTSEAAQALNCGQIGSGLNYDQFMNKNVDFTVKGANKTCSAGQFCANLKSSAMIKRGNKIYSIKAGIGGCVNAKACFAYAGGSSGCKRSVVALNYTTYNCQGNVADKLPMTLNFYSRCCTANGCNNKNDITTGNCPVDNTASAGLGGLFTCAEKVKRVFRLATCKAKLFMPSKQNKPQYCSPDIIAALRLFATCTCTPQTNSQGENMLIVKNWFSYLWRDFCDIDFKCNANGKYAITKRGKSTKVTIQSTNQYDAAACKALAKKIASDYDVPEGAVAYKCASTKANGKYQNEITVMTSNNPTGNFCDRNKNVTGCTVGATTATMETLEATGPSPSSSSTAKPTEKPSSASLPTLFLAVVFALIMTLAL